MCKDVNFSYRFSFQNFENSKFSAILKTNFRKLKQSLVSLNCLFLHFFKFYQILGFIPKYQCDTLIQQNILLQEN